MSNYIIPNAPEIDLVPLSQFSQRISEGWSMVPGYPLEPGDYAVTMRAPGRKEPKRNTSCGALSNQHRLRRIRAEAGL